MAYIVSQITKYVIMISFGIYTFECFRCLKYAHENEKKYIYLRQNILMTFIHLLSFFTLFVSNPEKKYLVFFILEEMFFWCVIFSYKKLYPNSNGLIINNMCMLLMIGLVIIGRISFEKSIRQFYIMCFSSVITLFIPFFIKKIKHLEKLEWIYSGIGVISLLAVLIFSKTVNGSKINITVMNYTFQPSEYVKIIFVFAIACLLYNNPDIKKIVLSAVLAGIHVLLLVASKDLGSAIIFFIIYFSMLYVATHNIFYYLLGLASGGIGAFLGYRLFSHVRVRVTAYMDPFGTIENAGYQIAQSLFAIGTGSWFGMGLNFGAPGTIPVVTADFIFAAIVEELGIIFGICLILVCLSCFVCFINISMNTENVFYKLIAFGLAVGYGFQVFLTIGGVTKFIPLTGVTLPLVSYGGTSIVVTLCVFAIIQGIYILREDKNDALLNDVPINSDANNDVYDFHESVERTKIMPDEEDISFNLAVEEGLKIAMDDPEDYKLEEFDLFDEKGK